MTQSLSQAERLRMSETLISEVCAILDLVANYTTPNDAASEEALVKLSKLNGDVVADLSHRLAVPSQSARPVASEGEAQELIDRVQFVMDAPAKDRWKIANLTNHDWRRILAALHATLRHKEADHGC